MFSNLTHCTKVSYKSHSRGCKCHNGTSPNYWGYFISNKSHSSMISNDFYTNRAEWTSTRWIKSSKNCEKRFTPKGKKVFLRSLKASNRRTSTEHGNNGLHLDLDSTDATKIDLERATGMVSRELRHPSRSLKHVDITYTYTHLHITIDIYIYIHIHIRIHIRIHIHIHIHASNLCGKAILSIPPTPKSNARLQTTTESWCMPKAAPGRPWGPGLWAYWPYVSRSKYDLLNGLLAKEISRKLIPIVNWYLLIDTYCQLIPINWY